MTNFNKKITQDQFNSIADLRHYLLLHPDYQMVRAACLHFLGDQFTNFDIRLRKEAQMTKHDKLIE